MLKLSPKTHHCSKCTRSFATRKALTDHNKSTGHGFPCTVPKCQKIFLSSAALQAHSLSQVHVAIVTMEGRGQTERNGSTAASCAEQSIAPMKSSSLGIIKDPARHSNVSSVLPLYAAPLGSRWSIIPVERHTSATTVLRSMVPTASTRSLDKFGARKSVITAIAPPVFSFGYLKRRAIVLDCEMVRVGPDTSELARLSAIDYLTNEILIDTLVEPSNKVTDWRTQWSGITAKAMNAAVASGTALKGSVAARSSLFNYIDEHTILVGHALHHDLAALGICSSNVVDSAELAKKTVGMGARKAWGLKSLCQELLGVSVQDHGKNGHDSVEDSFAAREVVLWCIQNGGPYGKLEEWGKQKKNEILEGDRIRKARKNTKNQTRLSRVVAAYDSDDLKMESLSLEEFNEMCGYPEWYDNWSD